MSSLMSSYRDVGKKVAISFLRDYNEFGSRSHLLTANAIKNAIDSSADADDKKVLAVKAYSEFISALEDLGAICIAVRHRDDGRGIVYAFLTYGQTRNRFAPKTSLREIFRLCQSGNGLSEALLLPPLEAILSLESDLRPTILPTLYQQANVFLSQAGSAYLHENGAFVRAYNKTKHGFVVVKDRHVLQLGAPETQDGAAWIIGENPAYDPSKPDLTNIVELFSVRIDVVPSIADRIMTIRGAIMTICELTAVLLERGIITSTDSKA